MSNLGDEGVTLPPLDQLLEFRMIVTTLVTAGRLVSAMVPSYHFNYIFIDEAGQVPVLLCPPLPRCAGH